MLGEGKNFQYVGIFDTVMEFESDNDKYRLDLDLGRNMEASVTSASGKLYEFGIEKMVMHTGSLRHEIENNAKAIHQLFMLYDQRLEFGCFEWDTISDEKTVEFHNTSGVGIKHIELHGEGDISLAPGRACFNECTAL